MMLAACSLLLPATIATAQESSSTGVVQLGHKNHSGYAAESCDGCVVGYGDGNGCGYGCNCGCNNGGNCRCGKRGRGFGRHHGGAYGGQYGYGQCGDGCNGHCGQCCIGQWLNRHSPYHTCKLPPDHGFSTPAHRPMLPQPAMYRNMFPGSWTGQASTADPGARHPMVYMPTDTTQLGYYYQQVPYWRTRPGMIPPVPQPGEWHTPETGVVFTGYEDADPYGMFGGCPDGQVIDGGIVNGSTIEGGSSQSYPSEGTPVQTSPVPMHESSPVAPYSPQPVNPQMVPPSHDIAPELPVESGAPLGKSAASPQLMPVPRR